MRPVIAGFMLDGAVKGVTPHATLPLADVGAQGWNLLRGDLPMPAAILRTDILRLNSAWMAEFTRRNRLDLCPQGKTTMAPQLWSLQLADGAWASRSPTRSSLPSPYVMACRA